MLEEDITELEIKKLASWFNKVEKELLPVLVKITDSTGQLNIKELGKYNRKKKINAIIIKLVKDYKNKFGQQLRNTLEKEYKDNVAMMQDYINSRTDMNLNKLPVTAVKSDVIDVRILKGKSLKEFLDKTFSDITFELQRRAIDGISRGLNPRTLVSELKTEGFSMGAKRLNATIRTWYNDILNIADEHTYRQAGIEKVRYSSVLDARTCAECASLDGKIYSIDDKKELPKHVNCRCLYLAIITKEDEKTNVSYINWLKDGRRSKKQLEDIGKEVARYYKAGQISKTDMQRMLSVINKALKDIA